MKAASLVDALVVKKAFWSVVVLVVLMVALKVEMTVSS